MKVRITKVPDKSLNARKWKHSDGGFLDNYYDEGGPYGVIPLGDDYLTYLQTMPEVPGGVIEPSVVTAALPSKFNGSQAAAARYAEGYQKGAKPVSEAMNRAGQDIFNAVDTVVGLTPTPAGAITWLGHMGADAAEGRWGRVGRDVALAAALGAGARGVGWLKNYVDDATNYGEDLFRAFTDRAPGRVSTNFTYSAPSTRAAVEAVPAVTNAVSAPYEIADLGGGYMLKSLMRGNPLEKQISKNGTVNVNNVKALVGKGSKVEQAVVDKVLASEEFAGKKSIDYNRFRKAVQDELITYDRIPDTRWADYGVSRLGLTQSEDLSHLRNIEDYARSDRFDVVSTDTIGQARLWRDKFTGDILNWDGITQRYLGEHDVINAGPGLNTFTFSSSRIPAGSSKHYNQNTIGHSRTYTSASEPDILHVMESQSDWGQGYKKMNLDGEYNQKRINSLERRINNLKESINSETEGLMTEKMNDGSDMSPWFADSLRKQIEKDKQLLEELTVELDMRRNPKLATQQDYLAENFTSRQIQENLRYAAEKGQTKMRYPTKETAAKIEGYPKETNYYDADGNLVTDSRKIYTIGKENEKELDLIQRELDGYYAKFNVAQLPNGDYVPAGNYSDNPYQQLIEAIPRKQAAYDGWRANHPNATSEKGQRVVDEMKQRAEEIKNFRARVKYLNQRMKELKSIKPYVDPSIKEEVKYMHEDDILRKYNDFPKQFKKLYKGADVRIVTDPKGNTWYEVDVPEDYLQQEWPFEEGGSLILPKMMMDKYSPDKLRKAIAKMKWKHGDGGFLDNYFYDGGPYGVIPLGGDLLEYYQTTPDLYGGMIEPSVVTAPLPAKFNGSQEAAARYAEGYQWGKENVKEPREKVAPYVGAAMAGTLGLASGLSAIPWALSTGLPAAAKGINWLGEAAMPSSLLKGISYYAPKAAGALSAASPWLDAAALSLWSAEAGNEAIKAAKDKRTLDAVGYGLLGSMPLFATGYGLAKNAIGKVESPFRLSPYDIDVTAMDPGDFRYAPAARATAPAKAAVPPYEIETYGGGYMLRSLMPGNPLEKQISKSGTVNVNNIRALVAKGSKVDQAVVDKVLTEKFAGQKAVDYNQFRKAVQDELITYDIVPSKKYEVFGMDKLGYPISSTELSDIAAGRVAVEGAQPNTITFESPRMPSGNSSHYNARTLGHSRTFISEEEPDILHVLESQSDRAQKGTLGPAESLMKDNEKHRIKVLKALLDAIHNGSFTENEFITERAVKDALSKAESPFTFAGYYKPYKKPEPQLGPQENHLMDEYVIRQIQENLKYAAGNNLSKMRYPTPETAAKIEGYEPKYHAALPGQEQLHDQYSAYRGAKEVLDSYKFPRRDIMYAANGTEGAGKATYLMDADGITDIMVDEITGNVYRTAVGNGVDYHYIENVPEIRAKVSELPAVDIPESALEYDRLRDEYQKTVDLMSKSLTDTKDKIIYSSEAEYSPSAKTILKKYADFPKQFKKLYKGADVRIVTDPKGNTWYEVDVPEDYLQQEWPFEEGGSLILPKMMMDKYSPDKLRKAIAKIKAGR